MEWKQINGYPDYAISCEGQVKSLRFDRILKNAASNAEYYYVNIIHNKIKKTTAVHKLVMEHFGSECPGTNYVIDHIDGNKTNNHISNLEWVTIQENTLRAYGNGDKKLLVIELKKQGLTAKQISESTNLKLTFIYDTINKNM